MSKAYNLERVIRRVTPNTQPARNSEKLVIIDVKQGRAVERVGLINFGREFRYFIVSNSDDKNNEAYGTIHLTYGEVLGPERTIDIDINYRAWCNSGKETQVAEALFHGTDLGDVLNGLISRWVLEKISSQNGSFMTSNNESKNYLEATIRTKALMEVGLSMEIDLLVRLPVIPPVLIKDSFSVRANNYDRDENLIVSAELQADQGTYLKAIQQGGAALSELFGTELRKYFAHSVSLHNSYYKLNDDLFKQSLIENLNDNLKQVGRKVAFISIERDPQVPLPVESIRVQVSIAYQIPEDLEVAIIKNTVVLRRDDVVKYRTSGSPDLNVWIEARLEEFINEELITAKSTELLIDYPSFEERIKRKLSDAALNVGYKLENMISKPDLEPYRWLDGIEIKTDDSEEEFETVIPELVVKLSIHLRVQIRDLKGIKHLLDSQQHIPALMKEAVLGVIKQLLRETHPGQLYLRYSQLSKQNEPALEDKLTERLSEMLEQGFNAKIISSTFKLRDTEITEALNKLQSERCVFKVLIPRNRNNPEDCVLRGYFKVKGVDQNGWDEFRKTMPSTAQIKNHLEGSIRTVLENHPSALMRIRDASSLDEVENVVTGAAQSSILNDFGLKIVVTNIGIDATESEKKLAESVTNSETKRVENELTLYFSNVNRVREQVRKLEHEIIMVKAGGGGEDVIAKIQKQIDVLISLSPLKPITSGLCCDVQKQVE